MPKIIDVIRTKQGQTFLLLDELPRCVYERTGNLLVSNDGGFYDFLQIVPGSWLGITQGVGYVTGNEPRIAKLIGDNADGATIEVERNY